MSKKVTIRGGDVQFPTQCVVCDCENAQLVQYLQAHFPIPVPIPGFGGIGIFRRSDAWLPYCEAHAAAFKRRFRALTIIQNVIAVFAIGFVIWGVILSDEKHGGGEGWNLPFGIGVFCLCILLPASLIVRSYLYDAYFQVRASKIVVKSRHPRFLERLRELNRHALE
jgi:MFS family permease